MVTPGYATTLDKITASALTPPTASALGLYGCEVCHALTSDTQRHCRHCQSPIEPRARWRLGIMALLLFAAFMLYLPANWWPVLYTHTLLGHQSDTIMGGVRYLWTDNSEVLALILFVASIVVPLFKLIILTVLLLSVWCRFQRFRRQRTQWYRWVETIGRWSMLDVYVVSLLTTVVQFNHVVSMRPGPGTWAFSAVVILTMLASLSFDPRMLWEEGRDEPLSKIS